MHEHISFNGEIVPAGNAQLNAVSAAALYGRGVFTTIAVRSGQAFLWEKHWKRLQNDASKIMRNIGDVTEQATKQALSKLIERNDLSSGRARITIFDESPSDIWPAELTRKISALITTAADRQLPSVFRVELSLTPVASFSKTSGIKSCNYLDALLAHDETRRRGFNEAIRLNERGEVVSACMANVFWLRNGRLFTPDLTSGCVAGTTREFILDSLECQPVSATRDQLVRADAIFLTSAGLGIVQVAELEGKQFQTTDHPIMHLLEKTA